MALVVLVWGNRTADVKQEEEELAKLEWRKKSVCLLPKFVFFPNMSYVWQRNKTLDSLYKKNILFYLKDKNNV